MKLLLLPIFLFSPQSFLLAANAVNPDRHPIQFTVQAVQPIRFIHWIELESQEQTLESRMAQAVGSAEPQPLKPIRRIEVG